MRDAFEDPDGDLFARQGRQRLLGLVGSGEAAVAALADALTEALPGLEDDLRWVAVEAAGLLDRAGALVPCSSPRSNAAPA
ncbi:MAG: hypothetical protein H6701_14075 [Myxococcales bacterium]|nr:hypothetical protein [Myxococcales bacterium]